MKSISELVEQLGSNDQVAAYGARQELTRLSAEASKPGSGTSRADVASALAAELTATTKSKRGDGREDVKPKYSSAVRSEIAQLLSAIADDAQVPALASALTQLDNREMARWALDRMPTPAATSALIAALEQVGPEFRTGVINALAKRKGAEVQAALLRAAADEAAGVRLAAIEALANFPEPSNDEPIASAAKNGGSRARARANRARVRLAETLRNAGKKDAAVAIYKAIVANDSDEPQKKAARLALEQLT
jgi:HEAT repeat protein